VRKNGLTGKQEENVRSRKQDLINLRGKLSGAKDKIDTLLNELKSKQDIETDIEFDWEVVKQTIRTKLREEQGADPATYNPKLVESILQKVTERLLPPPETPDNNAKKISVLRLTAVCSAITNVAHVALKETQGELDELEKKLDELEKGLEKERAKTSRKALNMVGLHYLDAKFMRKKEQSKQLSLFKNAEPENLEQYEGGKFGEGIDLSLSEHKAITGVINLLTDTNYEGQRQEFIEDKKYSFSGTLPVILTTKADFLRACGAELTAAHDHTDTEALRLLGGLYSIASRNFPIAYRKLKREWVKDKQGRAVEKPILNEKGERQYSIIGTFQPLINLYVLFNDATEVEYQEIVKGNFSIGDRKVSKLRIKPNPLLIDEINNYFVEIPTTLFLECKRIQTKRGWRISKYPPLFIEWLHRHSYHQSQHPETANLSIDYLKLAETLKMGVLIESRQWKRIKNTLRQCYIVALEQEYLKEFPQSGAGIIQGWDNKGQCGFTIPGKEANGNEVFTLNEEAFTALRKKLEALPEEKKKTYIS
jgi:hypothetical protein